VAQFPTPHFLKFAPQLGAHVVRLSLKVLPQLALLLKASE
jgi:hypothetical protein